VERAPFTRKISFHMMFLQACFVVFVCRHMSAELSTYIDNSVDNCQQVCRHMSTNKLLQTVFNSYQVEGKFHGWKDNVPPCFPLGKRVCGAWWKVERSY
jgi:hypothetical protein